MMNLFKKALPHIVALAIFAAISAVFFYPQYQGKALNQGDVTNYEGMDQDVREHMVQYGEHPFWMGRMFGGMPSNTVSMPHQGRYIATLGNALKFMGEPASMIFITMAGFYLMLVMFGVNPWIAIAGSVGYGLSTYFPIIISAGHITKMWALQWIAPMIGSIWWTYRKNMVIGAALTGLFASLEISAYHPQIAYYFIFVVIALVVAEFVRFLKAKQLGRFFKRSGVLVLAAGLAVGSNFISLYYTADYTKVSTRSASELTSSQNSKGEVNTSGGLDKDYITAWSYGKAETFNLFIPNFYGGGREFQKGGAVDTELKGYDVPSDYYKYMPSYFGEQPFTEGPVYIGAVLIFLALFGMFVVEGNQKWWILAPAILALMLSWGRNFMWLTDFFIDYVPMYNKFRVPSMMLVVVEWALPTMAMLGLWQLSKGVEAKKFMTGFKWSAGLSLGFALLAAIVLPSTMNFASASDGNMPEQLVGVMESERASLLRMDAWRTFIFVAIAAGAVWMFYKGKIKVSILALAVGALVLIDMWGVDRRYIAPDDFKPRSVANKVMATKADEIILADTTNFRVADFAAGSPFESSRASYFHRSIGGYSAAKMRRYQELIDYHLSKMNPQVYDMLNTKYYITDKGVELLGNPAGNAWFVDSIAWVNSPDEEIAALAVDKGFDARKVAVVDKRWQGDVPSGASIAADSTSRAVLTSYKVNAQTYKTSSLYAGLVVFSEIYYDGWKVTIDGAEAKPIRVDYVLRGVEVPSGNHTVEWSYTAKNFALAATISTVSSLTLLLGALLAFLWQGFKVLKSKRDE